MTNYAATPASNLQAMINALLPGDVLTLGAGTFSNAAINVTVSGNETEPITIRGTIATDGSHSTILSTPGGTTQGWKITGSYIHIEGVDVQNATRGFELSAASHVKIWDVWIRYCPNEGVWVHNNSHHIFLWSIWVGTVDLPAANFTIGYRVGTPNASWTNANTPDRTNNVHIYDAKVSWIKGWTVQVCEGAHHVLVEDVFGDQSSGPTNRPAKGSANGDGGFNSRGDFVQFVRCFCAAPTVNYFKIDRITVGGVEYGHSQELKGGGGRPFGVPDPDNFDPNLYFPGVASNTNDLKVYRNFFDVYRVPVNGFDDTGGSWAAHGWKVPAELFTKMDISGPARRYTLEPLPFGQYFAFGDMQWRVAGDPSQVIPFTTPLTYGNEFVVDRPGGRVVGYAYQRRVTEIAPTLFRVYREEFDENVYLKKAPPSPVLEEYASYEDWSQAFLAWEEVYGNWLYSSPDYLAMPSNTAVVETTKVIPSSSFTGQKWVFGYIDNPFDLIPNYHYQAAFLFPTGTWVSGHIGHSMGLFIQDFWGRSYGANSIVSGPLTVPTCRLTGQIANDDSVSGLDNRPGNVTTRYFSAGPSRQPSGLLYRSLPGETMVWPDMSVLGSAVPMSPIVSYARTVPETVTVTPDMDLQNILDTRIPGDTVIISGTHRGAFVTRESGVDVKPIHLVGDGTARLRYRFGRQGALPALHIKSSYIWVENIVFEEAAKGLLIENGVKGIRVEDCTAQFVAGDGFVAQEDSEDICFISCHTTDTGLSKVTGSGFRIGRHAGSWIQDSHPDGTTKVLVQDCTVTRAYGAGITACDGATLILVKTCSVNHTAGNTPSGVSAGTYYDPAAGYWSRADQIQFEACTVTGAPGAGFLIFDSTWYPNTTNYGRLQEVKGGSSTGQGDAGVVSQSEGLKVYADFTVGTGTRIREIAGGWAAAGSSVAATAFRELGFASVAQHYPPNEA